MTATMTARQPLALDLHESDVLDQLPALSAWSHEEAPELPVPKIIAWCWIRRA